MAYAAFYRRNRDFLQPFSPTFQPEQFSKEAWIVKLRIGLEQYRAGESMRCGMFNPGGELIGVVNFHSMVKLSLFQCLLGYALDEHEQGRGILTQCLEAAIPRVFGEFRMHRIVAAYMPRNERSGRLLKRLGFRVEGYCEDYLMIDGKWEDHILTGKLNEDWRLE